MFRKSNFKKILISTLALIMILSTVVVAANNIHTKEIKATFGRIKFNVDGKDVTKEIESKYGSPAFVVEEYNNRSYLPVRAIAEYMGLKIVYDDVTHTAHITDPKAEEHKKELKKKDDEIVKLEKEIKDLKKEVVVESDIEDLEKEIRRKYSIYKNLELDINLREGSGRIDIDLIMDLRNSRQESAWNRINYYDREYLAEDIVDMVAAEFPNVDIYGTLFDNDARRNVLEFNKRKNSSFRMTYGGRTSSSSSSNYREIERRADIEFSSDGVEDARVINMRESRDDISFTIDFLTGSRSDWREIEKKSSLERSLDRIADEAIYYYDDYYRDIDVTIYIEIDGDRQGRYEGRYDRYRDEIRGSYIPR